MGKKTSDDPPPTATASSLRDAVMRRDSVSRVDERAPDDEELLALIEAAGSVADHAGLRPWRLIALRGAARQSLGEAIAEASGADGKEAQKLADKPLRAPLLIAVVVSPTSSRKVPDWEQEATAAGVAHMLSLLLDDAGWGVMWRTGAWTRTKAVAKAHRLAPTEKLLGWLYVGGRLKERSPRRSRIDPRRHLSTR